MKTMRELAEEALAVQDASNLSGVAAGFCRVVADLKYLLPEASTDALAHHPICALWADKIASMTGAQCFGDNSELSRAYAWAHDMIGEREVPDLNTPPAGWNGTEPLT